MFCSFFIGFTAMIQSLEPLFCPCCTPALLHALAQYGVYTFSQPLNLLGTGSLIAAVGLEKAPQLSTIPDAGNGAELVITPPAQLQ